MIKQAIEKLRRELKEDKGLGRAGQVMAEPVAKALCGFCEQDEEFAQAVMQGGSFNDCMKTVEKNCGIALSDLDAYRRAVQFYFPTADIRVSMAINLMGDEVRPLAPIKGGGIVLDLLDFL